MVITAANSTFFSLLIEVIAQQRGIKALPAGCQFMILDDDNGNFLKKFRLRITFSDRFADIAICIFRSSQSHLARDRFEAVARAEVIQCDTVF